MLSVGKVVIDAFFAGDASAWRKRGPKKISLRKLAHHPDLLMKPGALYLCVAIYELWQRLEIDAKSRLSTTHLRYCLFVKEIGARAHRTGGGSRSVDGRTIAGRDCALPPRAIRAWWAQKNAARAKDA